MSNSQTVTTEILINGEKYKIGVEVGNFVVTKVDNGGGTIPDPEKPTDFGTIKTGDKWSTNPGTADTWIFKNMDNPKTEFKFISANDQKNIIANIKTKEQGDLLRAYFMKNPFPPTGTGGGGSGGNGGNTGGGGGGGSGGGTTEPGVDEVEGVKLPFKTNGKLRTEGWNYNENDGLRVDYENNKTEDFCNNIMVLYGQFLGKVTEDQERCFKWTWGHHTGSSSIAKCYIVLARNKDGKSRARFEDEHPSGYSDLVPYGKGEADGLPCQSGKIWGLMGVRQNVVDASGKVTGVRLQIYEDMGGMVDGKPANQWKRLLDHIDTKWMITDYSKNGIEVTCRMDDDIGDKNIKVEKVFLTGIEPGKA